MTLSSNASPIGVAVIGCGNIANPHFVGWQRLVDEGQARLEVACDNDPSRAEEYAKRYGAATWATDFEEVVRRPEVQAIDICLPHHLHLPAILAAARAGKHVISEKPLVLDLDQAVEAIRACRDAGVILMTADRDRFEPHARVVKSILDQGLLGQVNLILERHMLHKDVLTQAANNNMSWKLHKSMAGGGALHRDGCYYIDTLLYWGGEVAHITGAEFDNFLWQTQEVETTSHVLFRFRSGAIGVFEMVWCLQGPHIREITINGSEGYLSLSGGISHGPVTIRVHSQRLKRQILNDSGVVWSFEETYFKHPDTVHPDYVGEELVIRVPYAAGFHAQSTEFLAAIREGRQPQSSGIDGARAIEVVEGAYLAARERRAIDFPLRDWASLAAKPMAASSRAT